MTRPSAATTSSTAQPGCAEHLGDLRGEGGRLGDHAAYRPGGDDLAVGEDHDVVGGLGDELHVVGGDQDRVPVGGQVAQDPGQHALGRVVEAAGRLVEQHHAAAAATSTSASASASRCPSDRSRGCWVVGDAGHQPVEDPAALARVPPSAAAHSSATVSR